MPKIALEIENARDATFLWELLNSPEGDRGHRTQVAAWTTLVYDDARRPEAPGEPWRFWFTLEVDASVPRDRSDKIAMDIAQELVRRMARHTSRLREAFVQGRPVAFQEGPLAAAIESALERELAAAMATVKRSAAAIDGNGTGGKVSSDERRHELALRAAMDQLLSEGLISFTLNGDQRLVSRAPRPMSPVDLTMVDLVLQQYRTVRAAK